MPFITNFSSRNSHLDAYAVAKWPHTSNIAPSDTNKLENDVLTGEWSSPKKTAKNKGLAAAVTSKSITKSITTSLVTNDTSKDVAITSSTKVSSTVTKVTLTATPSDCPTASSDTDAIHAQDPFAAQSRGCCDVLVVDTAGFLKHCALETMSQKLITLPEVRYRLALSFFVVFYCVKLYVRDVGFPITNTNTSHDAYAHLYRSEQK